MKTFTELFLESLMDLTYALKIFGIDEVPSRDMIKKLYKKLTLKNHPDRGGSNEQMALINTAYEFLMKQRQGSKFSGTDWKSAFSDTWEDRRTEKEIQDRNDLNQLTAEESLKVFNQQYELIKKVLPLYCKYFKKVTNKEFTANLKDFCDYNQFKGKTKKYGHEIIYEMPSYVSWNIEINDTQKEIFFDISMYTKIDVGGMRLAGEDHNIDFECNGIVDGRKNKLFNISWGNYVSAKKALTNPDELFANTRMQRILKGNARSAKKGTRFMKRDAIMYIDKILNGETKVANDVYMIPLCEKDGKIVLLDLQRIGKFGSLFGGRSTAKDPAYWSIGGLKLGRNSTGYRKFTWDEVLCKGMTFKDKEDSYIFLECQENFEILKNIQSKMKNCNEKNAEKILKSEIGKISFIKE